LLFSGKAVLEVTLPSPVLAVRYNLFSNAERGGGSSLGPTTC